jgi:hypothetical protein
MNKKESHPRHLIVTLVLLAAALGLAAVPAHAAGPFQYFPVTPCRVFDTRTTGTQTNGMPLTNPGPHNFRIQGNCGVPNGAQAVTLNATVVSPSRPGDLRLYPATGSAPTVSTLNYTTSETLANGAIVPLNAVSVPTDDDLGVVIGMTASGTIHLIIDVTGYFM